MKKSINVKIGGIIFHIEEGGYSKLKEYLETTQKSAGTFNLPSALMENIENRIAETLLYKLRDGLQVVTLEDVEDLLDRRERLTPTISETRLSFL